MRVLSGRVVAVCVVILATAYLASDQFAITPTPAPAVPDAAQPAPLADTTTTPVPTVATATPTEAMTTAGPPTPAPPTAVPPTAAPPTAGRPTTAPPRAAPPTAKPPKAAAAGTRVPASIDATCASNASPALNAWIASRPNGSTLVFPAGSCYRLGGDAGLNLTGRNGLTLIGTGSTLQLRTTGASNFSAAFFLQQSDHITIRGFRVDGANTASGTSGAWAGLNEAISGAMVRAGSDFVKFDHVTWDHLFGFGILLTDKGGAGDWPSDVSIRNSRIRGAECGVCIVAGRRVQIVGNVINDSMGTAIDLEPDQPQQGFQNVLISDNDFTRYGWVGTLTTWWVAANPADAVVGSVVMDGLTVTGNRVHRGAATANNGNADGLGGLGIRADKANRKRNFVITNNWTVDNDTRSSTRFVINLDNVQNLRVTGNRQPIANGAGFVSDTGTTGTRVVSGNNVAP